MFGRISVSVALGKVLFVRELIDKQQATHTVDMMFACRSAGDYIAQNGTSPDIGQEQLE
ncbi:MAG: hypothetical protein VKL59_22280 [Nostocaceae cyanobacterium]|nr:hypothetical protein [Nostocaceae cyanobacterium]